MAATRALTEPARYASSAVLAGQSDERLVELVRAGHARAFDVIVRRYRRPLLRHCSRVLPAGRAEDAVQQAFMRAYDGLRRDDSEIKLRPWLYRIAHRCALNALAQNGWNHAELSDRIDGVEQPDDVLDRRERLTRLVDAVRDLPPRQRQALVLREFDDRSYAEISAALAVSDGAVRQLLARARDGLRRSISVLTPPGLATQLADGSLQQRVSALAGGAGGGAVAIKVAVGVLAATTVVAGGQLILRDEVKPHRLPGAAAASSTARAGVRAASDRLTPRAAAVARPTSAHVQQQSPAAGGNARSDGAVRPAGPVAVSEPGHAAPREHANAVTTPAVTVPTAGDHGSTGGGSDGGGGGSDGGGPGPSSGSGDINAPSSSDGGPGPSAGQSVSGDSGSHDGGDSNLTAPTQTDGGGH